jgi:putative polyhydroxyalkanoate system protein
MSIPHQLTRAQARQRVEQMVTDLQSQYGAMVGNFENRWDGDTLEFRLGVTGINVSGHVYVEDQVVRVDVPLPWPLAMFAGTMRQRIETEGRKLLAR